MIHAGLLTVTGDPTRPDGLEFRNQHGRPLTHAPPPATSNDPTEAAARAGLTPGTYTGPACEPLHDWSISWN
jgi:hypothetical protein